MSVFETRHQHLAAYCLYAGLVLLEVKRLEPKGLLFVFDDREGEGPELNKQFAADDRITSARSLLHCYDELRKEIRKVFR